MPWSAASSTARAIAVSAFKRPTPPLPSHCSMAPSRFDRDGFGVQVDHAAAARFHEPRESVDSVGRDPVRVLSAKMRAQRPPRPGLNPSLTRMRLNSAWRSAKGTPLDRGGRVQDTASLSNPAKREGKKRWGSPGSENRTFWRGVSSTVSGGSPGARTTPCAKCSTCRGGSGAGAPPSSRRCHGSGLR